MTKVGSRLIITSLTFLIDITVAGRLLPKERAPRDITGCSYHAD